MSSQEKTVIQPEMQFFSFHTQKQFISYFLYVKASDLNVYVLFCNCV